MTDATDDQAAVESRVDVLLADGRFDEAFDLVGSSDVPWRHALRGDIAYAAGDLPAARDHYVVALAGGVADVALRLGNIHAELGDQAEAERLYVAVAEAGEPMGWRNLALDLGERDPERAAALFRRAYVEGDRRSGLLLGELLLDLDRPDEALPVLQEVLDAGEGEAAIDLGLTLREGGRPAEAEKVFRRGIAAGAVAAVTPYLASLLVQRERSDEAVAAYRAALAGAPDDADLLCGLADTLSGTDAVEAEALYRRAVELGEVHALNNLGVLLEELGRVDEAAELYDRGAALGDALARKNLLTQRSE